MQALYGSGEGRIQNYGETCAAIESPRKKHPCLFSCLLRLHRLNKLDEIVLDCFHIAEGGPKGRMRDYFREGSSFTRRGVKNRLRFVTCVTAPTI